MTQPSTSQAQAAKLKTLTSQARALEIALLAKRMEIAVLIGETDDARRLEREWRTAVLERQRILEEEVACGRGCFFDARGEMDASTLHARVVMEAACR